MQTLLSVTDIFGLENPVLVINSYTQGKDGFGYTYSLVARFSPTRCHSFWIATEKRANNPVVFTMLAVEFDRYKSKGGIMKNKKALTAPCGLDCFNCHIYESNLTDELAELIHVKRGVPKEEIACKGCRQQDGKHYHLPQGCATLDCAKEKGVELCSDCKIFHAFYWRR